CLDYLHYSAVYPAGPWASRCEFVVVPLLLCSIGTASRNPYQIGLARRYECCLQVRTRQPDHPVTQAFAERYGGERFQGHQFGVGDFKVDKVFNTAREASAVDFHVELEIQ